MRETQELVTIVPWTFIATICNLFIQCWLIKKFLFKPIREVIEKRRALADSQIQDAKKAKEEAETMKAGYEAEMAKAKETARQIPLERILLETDCPYMAPTPFRGKRNNSAYIDYVAKEIADLKGISKEEVIAVTEENAKKLFDKMALNR